MSNNVDFSRMKFYCDENLCVDCDGYVVACREAHEMPVGVNRRKVITVNEGVVGREFSLSMACMHYADTPCQQIYLTGCFHTRTDGIVLHNKDKCIGCGYCLFACPFGAPQFPKNGAFGTKGKMDKCTICAGGPEETSSPEESHKYGQNRTSEGKVPMYASICSTKALPVGDTNEVALIRTYRATHKRRDTTTDSYGW